MCPESHSAIFRTCYTPRSQLHFDPIGVPGQTQMNIVVLNEVGPNEARVALMPDSVKKLVAAKASVSIETGAGLGAARTDDDYREAGANVVTDRNELYGSADVLV